MAATRMSWLCGRRTKQQDSYQQIRRMRLAWSTGECIQKSHCRQSWAKEETRERDFWKGGKSSRGAETVASSQLGLPVGGSRCCIKGLTGMRQMCVAAVDRQRIMGGQPAKVGLRDPSKARSSAVLLIREQDLQQPILTGRAAGCLAAWAEREGIMMMLLT